MSGEHVAQLVLAIGGIVLMSLPIVLWVRNARRRAELVLPRGFADDMRIDLPIGVTHEKLASFVIGHALRSIPDDETERQLIRQFALSAEDAAHVRDRVFGGAFRAALALAGNPHNGPNVEKDPLAFAGFARVIAEPEIARRIYPQFASERPAG